MAETREVEPDLADLPSPAPETPVEALEWLGDTADEVAANLRLLGVTGVPVQAGSCPLANYLKTWWDKVSIWENVDVWNENGPINYGRGETPKPCFEFASKFDWRGYPDLIA